MKNQTLFTNNHLTFIAIFLAYLFSVIIRYYWIYEFSSLDEFIVHGSLIINNSDGFAFAEGARDYLAGFHQPHDYSRIDETLPRLTALLVMITPFSLEQTMLYLPIFLGSFIVIPLVLIGRFLGNISLGFMSALIASIAHSYYNRTMAGYYDTDMLTIVFPLTIIMLLAMIFRDKKEFTPLILGILLSAYQSWYDSAYSINLTLTLLIAFIVTLKYKRQHYFHTLILFMLGGTLLLPLGIKIAILAGMYVVIKKIPSFITSRLRLALGTLFLIIIFANEGLTPLIDHIRIYFVRYESSTLSQGMGFIYLNVGQTIREASQIPFDYFAERISGHVVLFILSIIGYGLFLKRYPIMLFSLPMMLLGMTALWGGLRFTIYAVPFSALGIAYLGTWLMEHLRFNSLKILAFTTITSLALYPHIRHIQEYKVPPVFIKDEVTILEKFKQQSQREDYGVSWWDYGYPIRYYSDVKTWSDGGKHAGDINFPSSLVLTTTSPRLSANLLRTLTEYTEKQFSDPKYQKIATFEYMFKGYGWKDYDTFYTHMSHPNFTPPPKSRDVYLILPYRMMDIFPTVYKFSHIDITTGESYAEPLYDASGIHDETQEAIVLKTGRMIHKKELCVIEGTRKIPIRTIHLAQYDTQKLNVITQHVSQHGSVDIFILPHYKNVIIADTKMADSTFMQMFFLENYDSTLFEKVSITPLMKIYKVKF